MPDDGDVDGFFACGWGVSWVTTFTKAGHLRKNTLDIVLVVV
jgi:hypothetical protein